MLDMVLNVIREQSVFVLAGLWLAGGLFSQFMASRRYRKLRGGIQSLAALQAPSSQGQSQAAQLVRSERAEKRRQAQLERDGQAEGLRMASETAQEPAAGRLPEAENPPQEATQEPEGEVDSQLLYLRQSLDRIAAGRDQRLEDEPHRRKKLTPAEEQIIIDILKEYLS